MSASCLWVALSAARLPSPGPMTLPQPDTLEPGEMTLLVTLEVIFPMPAGVVAAADLDEGACGRKAGGGGGVLILPVALSR